MLKSSFQPTREVSVPRKATNTDLSGSRKVTAANCVSWSLRSSKANIRVPAKRSVCAACCVTGM